MIESYHGKIVTDPYRWLENPYSDETKQFIDAENEISQSFLAKSGQWQKINEKLTEIWNYTKYIVPQRHGNYYFSYKNTGLQSQ